MGATFRVGFWLKHTELFDWIGKAIDWLKSPRQFGTVFVACVAFLAVPQSCVHRFGLDEFKRYRGWVSVAAFVSGAALLVTVLIKVWTLLSDAIDKRHAKKTREKYLLTLSPREKFIIAKYISGETETQYLELEDGNVGALIRKGIIYRAADVGRYTTFAFNIQPWVKEYLASHGDVLNNAKPPRKTPPEKPRIKPPQHFRQGVKSNQRSERSEGIEPCSLPVAAKFSWANIGCLG